MLFRSYYDELASENAWGFRLLKRKQKLERVSIFQKDSYDAVPENFEYYNFFEVLDTVLLPEKPIQADISFSCKAAHVPMNIYAVMEIQAADDVTSPQFIRVPLNLIKYDWNNTANFTTSIVSGNLPKKIKRLVIYLWNIDKSTNQISIQSFKLYELKGSGLTIISKAAI